MKIVIPGGTGRVGTLLSQSLFDDGHEVVVLSRAPRPSPWRVIAWDGVSAGDWRREVDGADVVINLAGRDVNCRYSAKHREEILQSRVLSTRVIGDAIARARRPPQVWLQASTATIYAHRYDAPNDEATGLIGCDQAGAEPEWAFSIQVACAWERELAAARVPRTRTIAMRSAITLSPETAGIFDTLLGLVRYGLGGPAGDGRQFVSWIHYEDFLRAVRWLIDREDIAGAVNIAAPHPLPNAEFMRVLREAAGVRLGLPANRYMLEAGAFVLRSETELILKSRRVVPARLLEHGFGFQYPKWPEASRDLHRQWRLWRQAA